MSCPDIAIFVESHAFGGMERYTFDLVRGLRAAGASVLLVYNADNARVAAYCLKESVPNEPLYLRQRANVWHPAHQARPMLRILRIVYRYAEAWNNFKLIRAVLRSTKPAAFLSINGGYPASYAARVAVIAARSAGIGPVLMSVLSTPTPVANPPLIGQIEAWLDRRIEAATSWFVPNCKLAGTKLAAAHFHSAKIKVIATGVPVGGPESPVLRLSEVTIAGQTYHRADGDIWLGVLSYLAPGKGIDDLISAVSELKKNATAPRLRCLIVGDGPHRASLADLITRLGVGESVILSGKYEGDCLDIYRFVDIAALPSLHEGLPYTISEAMSCRLPVIGTNVGGIPEQIIDQVTGLLVEPGQPSQLAAALSSLVKDVDLRHRLGAQAFAHVRRLFSIDQMVHQTLALCTKDPASS